MQFGKVSLAIRGLGFVGLSSLSLATFAQELPSDAANGGATIASTRQTSETTLVPEVGGAQVGQRLQQKGVMPNLEPMHRINNRIANRVENRIDNRIDWDKDTDTGSAAAYTIATNQVRKASDTLRANPQTAARQPGPAPRSSLDVNPDN